MVGKSHFSGIVARHLGRGKKLGYPTANLTVPEDAPEGIFLAHATIVSEPTDNLSAPRSSSGHLPTLGEKNKERLPAVAFIGAAETFGESEKQLEVFILDFHQELYGQRLEVRLIEKLRDNQKFDTVEELLKQMAEDERLAREYFQLP